MEIIVDFDRRISKFASKFEAKYNESGSQVRMDHPGMPSQNELKTVGRIVCDSEAKLNEKSCLLETSREIGSGCMVPLALENIESYSLFPGQIVGIEGMNFNGDLLKVSKLEHGMQNGQNATLTSKLVEYQHKIMEGDPLVVAIAAGPFFRETTELDVLNDFLQNQITADVIILLGPFVDSSSKLLESHFNHDLFKLVTDAIDNFSQQFPHPQIIMMPSPHDDVVPAKFPQPALQHSNVICLSNPATFMINEIVFTVANIDILFHMNPTLISKQGSDRLSRMFQHILEQQNVYPLFPPAIGASIDYNLFSHLDLEVSPDVLICPSNLKQFCKQVGDTVCINPSHVVKGNRKGMFARMVVFPIPKDDLVKEEIEITSQISQRARVEIIKL